MSEYYSAPPTPKELAEARFLPMPEEIREQCLLLQQGWTPEEEEERVRGQDVHDLIRRFPREGEDMSLLDWFAHDLEGNL